MTGEDLRHHGDREVARGLIDLAVNVRAGSQPPWLSAALSTAMQQLASYPDQGAAVAAVARRHCRAAEEVLLTNGAAEAFVLLARKLRPRHAVVVHPQFTEPEAALLAAGVTVERVVLPAPFILESQMIPESADLVMVGNPTNPTSVLHPAATLAALARPGRTLVIDEAFADCVPGEPESLAQRRELPGLVVIRSLTKTWALAGLRCGYLLAEPELVHGLARVQSLWPVSTPALVAIELCSSAQAVALAQQSAQRLAAEREHLLTCLQSVGIVANPHPRASFVLASTPGAERLRLALRRRGFALRRGDTFPGLDERWLRIAVRDESVSDALTAAIRSVGAMTTSNA